MAKCSFLVSVFCFAVVYSDVLDHRFFIGQIIKKYGHNGTISFEGFERLYTNLGLGASNVTEDDHDLRLSRPSREVGELNSSKDCQMHEELERLVAQHKEVSEPVNTVEPHHCLSPRELLVVYGLTHSGDRSLSPVSFLHLCPAIIYELDMPRCGLARQSHLFAQTHSHSSAVGNPSHACWLFACLTILVISISGLLCVAVVPLLQKSFVSQLINFLVALAIGTLLGDAFLHLVPHALESHSGDEHASHTDSVLKTGLMFLTVVFFFTFEAVLNTRKNNKEESEVQEKVTFIPMTSTKSNISEKEMLDVEDKHMHSHSHHSHNDGNNIAFMVVMGDGLHNLTDGLAIGAAFSGGLAPGFATAVAVFTHELPHELGDFAVLLQAGMTVRKALFYNLVSSVLSFLGTAVGLIIGNFGDSTKWIYAITAGSFIYIALSNLVPEVNRQKSSWRTIFLRLSGILCGGGLMCSIALYEEDIHHMFL